MKISNHLTVHLKKSEIEWSKPKLSEENNKDLSGNKHNRGQENKEKSIKSKNGSLERFFIKINKFHKPLARLTGGEEIQINKIREVVILPSTSQK